VGRPERPLDASAGPIPAFALRLRELRREAGSPGYRELARTSSYSISALSDAAGGQRLPSLEVTLAFVEACGGDRQVWQLAWDKTRSALAVGANGPNEPALPGIAEPSHHQGPAPDLHHAQQPPAADRRHRGRFPPRLFERLSLVLVGGLLGSAATFAWHPTDSGHHHAAPPPTRHVADNTDPADTACDKTGSQRNAATVNLYYGPSRYVFGQITLRYSAGCDTGWARFDPTTVLMNRFDPHARLTLSLERPEDGRKISFQADYVGVYAWSNMLNAGGSCLRAGITATVPGAPPIHASTACVLSKAQG
jgi:hypothetical protein